MTVLSLPHFIQTPTRIAKPGCASVPPLRRCVPIPDPLTDEEFMRTLMFVFLLAGCASVEPFNMDPDGTYKIAVQNGEVSTPAVRILHRDDAARTVCPSGFAIVSEGDDLPNSPYGGHWWRIRCAS